MLSQKTHIKNNQSKCLLALAILFGLFSFAGYLHYTPTILQVTQTELVLSEKGENLKDAVFFCQAFEINESGKTLFFQTDYVNAQLAYKRLVEIQFKHFSQASSFIKISDRFLQVKTIPQSSEEDPFFSYIG